MQTVTRDGADIDNLAVRKFINVTPRMVRESQRTLKVINFVLDLTFIKLKSGDRCEIKL